MVDICTVEASRSATGKQVCFKAFSESRTRARPSPPQGVRPNTGNAWAGTGEVPAGGMPHENLWLWGTKETLGAANAACDFSVVGIRRF